MAIQDLFPYTDTIYKITKDIDLDGGTLNIPSNATLDFQGGKITNGSVTLRDTKIIPNGFCISDYIDANITGSFIKGQCLFDTSLNQPKWWNGNNWVDSNGTEIPD